MISILKRISLQKECLGLLCSVFLLFPGAALAQDAISFSVSPTIFDMTANPGQTWQSTVRIINSNPFELKVYVETNNFVPKSEDGIPRFLTIEQSKGEQSTFAEWITTEREVIIPAEKTVELPLKIMVPQDASPGGHFAALMISTKPPEGTVEKSTLQTSQVISSLIFLRVTGDITESGTIRSFRTSHYFLSKPETRFEIRIENKGNVHVQPQGEIKIFNMWGQERGSIPVNQQTIFGNVLPHSVRKYAFDWSSEWSITDIGRYTAVATLAYGVDTRQFMTSDTAFWIIPWKMLLLLFVTVGGFVALITWAMKLYIRHVLTLAGVHPSHLPGPVVATPKVKKAVRARDVTAPIEAGILDLRARLKSNHGTLSTYVPIIITFVKTYWKFFVGLLGIILFTSLVTWFVRGALTPSRDYQVVDPATGETIAGGEEMSTSTSTAPVLTSGTGVSVVLVDRSGDTSIFDRAVERIERAGFSIASTSEEEGLSEEKTVIVYNPDAADAALLLSRTLNNALLSSFTTTGTSTPPIVVYVGIDATTAQ